MNKLTATLAAGAATAAIGAATFAPLPASASTLPACRATQMHVTLGGEKGEMGHVELTLTARNTGRACTVHGYPPVSLEGTVDEPLAVKVKDTRSTWFGTGPAPSAFTLTRGQAVSALVSWTPGQDGQMAMRLAVDIGGQVKAPMFPGELVYVTGALDVGAWTKTK
jgi:hypothetical protein